jgi:acyl-coenzyme A thioesterase PaaI-like protein
MREIKPAVTLGKMKWLLFLLANFKIPMMGFLRPKLVTMNEETVEVKVKFNRRSKNHLNSMYFGALAVGADVAGGIHAFYFAEKHRKKVSFAFKSMHASFLKRAESDVLFVCNEGAKIEEIILESLQTQSRINQNVTVRALNSSQEEVAIFTMEISVKVY